MSNKDHEKKNGLNLVYDIGSASVACALVEYSPSELPKVIYVTRQRVRVEDKPSQEELLQSITEALDRATNELLNEGKKYIKRVGIFRKTSIEGVDAIFSAPWIASRTKAVKVTKEKPVIINERFVENVLKKEKSLFEQSLKEDPVFESDKGRDAEEDIIGFRLNGYTTNKPYGKSARTIEIALYLSYVHKAIAEKVMEKAEQNFNVKEVGLHTFPLVAQKYINILDPDITEYMLVDVTGEYTSITLVRNGTVYGTEIIKCGLHCLIRGVSKVFNAKFDVAQSYLRMNFEDKIDDDTKVKIKKGCDDTMTRWEEGIMKVIKKYGEQNEIPKHIFLISDRYGQDIFRESLEKTLEENNTTGQLFHVLPIGMRNVKNCCVFNQGARSDIFIGMEACHFNTCAFMQNKS